MHFFEGEGIVSLISTGLKCHRYHELNMFIYVDPCLDSYFTDLLSMPIPASNVITMST